MKQRIENALNKKKWAVVGASDNPERFGYKITKRLIDKGYEVYPINPNYEELLGRKVYKDLSEVLGEVDVVNVVVNKALSRKLIEEHDLSGLEAVWFQPNTFDDEIIALAEQKNPHVIYNSCVLVETNGRDPIV